MCLEEDAPAGDAPAGAGPVCAPKFSLGATCFPGAVSVLKPRESTD